jgi:peptidoglycan/LPS O-acetylase OafA/YrhL
MRSRIVAGFSGHIRSIRSIAAVSLTALLLAPGTALASQHGHSSFHPTIDIPQLLGIVLFILGLLALALLVRHARKADSMQQSWWLGLVVLAGLVVGLILMHSFGLPSFTLRKP